MLPHSVRRFAVLFFVASILVNAKATAQQFRQRDSIIISENVIYVSVQVNGVRRCNFMLDSGVSAVARIDQRLAKELGLNIVGFEENLTGTQLKREFLVGLAKLSLGQISYSNLKVRVGNYNTTPRRIRVDGILGRDFFSHYLLTIDGPGRQLLMTRANLEAQSKGVLHYSQPFLVSGQIGSKVLAFQLDTGSALPCLFPRSSLAGVRYTDTATQRVVTSAAISFVLQEAVIEDELVLGSVRVAEQNVYYSDKAHQVSVGAGFLKNHVITIDQQKQLVSIE